MIGGSAATRKVPEGLVGTMNATMAFYRAFPVFAAPFTLCSSTDTRFALLK